MKQLSTATCLRVYILLIISTLAAWTATAQTNTRPMSSSPRSSDAYIFPVRPGMPEWIELKTFAERLKVCQVPEPILEDMSTEALVETCLNYPFLGNITLFTTLNQGLEAVISNFNGLRELVERQDAGVELLKKYQAINPEDFDASWSPTRRGEYSLHLYYLGALMTYDEILMNMSQKVKHLLLQESFQKFQSMQRHPELYGTGSLSVPILLMAKIMEKAKYLPLEKRISKIGPMNIAKFKQKNPRFRNVELIPLTGDERYKLFLKIGKGIDEELVKEILLSGEEFLQ